MASAERTGGLEFSEKVVVVLGGVIASMALTVLNPVLPTIEKALAHSATDKMLVKQLFGVVTLAMVAGAPLGGFLVARLGMRRMLLIASLVYAVAGTAGLYLSSLPLLLVSRFFVGASAACIQVMSLTLVNTRLDPAGRAKWMGLHVAVATLCSLAIFPISGLLGQISWRLPFLEYLFGLVVFAALLFGKDMILPIAPKDKLGAQCSGPSLISWMPWHYVVLSLFVGAITFLPTIYSSYLFTERAGLTAKSIGLVMTFTAMVGGVSALCYGQVRKLLSIHGAFLASFGLASVGLLIVGSAHALPLMLAGFVLFGLGNAWFVPNVMTSLGGKLQPYQQARAAGLVKAGHFGSTPICVLLVAPFAQRLGAQSVMYMASAAAGLVFVTVLLRMTLLRARGQTTLADPGHPAAVAPAE